MKNNKLHTPIGVKDFLPAEFAFKTETERKIETVFHSYGFQSVCSPGFEFVEVFEAAGAKANMYKFIDDKNQVLALRADMTPPIARIAATAYDKSDLPLRFCYFENAYRPSENYQGKLREFTQAGIELIGSETVDAHAEVIALALHSLLAAGLTSFRIDIGQVEFLQGLLDETGFSEDICVEIQTALIRRDFVAVRCIVSENSNLRSVNCSFDELPFLMGGKAVLERARLLTENAKCLNALAHLESVYDILCSYGLEKYIAFDLSMLGHLDYYTGIIFSGYANGLGTSVIDGGQYDTLLKHFGADYPAMGFAIKIGYLLQALEVSVVKTPNVIPDILLAYVPETRDIALKTADQLRKEGHTIENSLYVGDLEASIKYAQSKKMLEILYFPYGLQTELINASTGKALKIAIDDLHSLEVSRS